MMISEVNYAYDLLKEIESGVNNVTKISKIREQRIATMFDFFSHCFSTTTANLVFLLV